MELSELGTIIYMPVRPHISFLVEEVPWPIPLETMQLLVGGYVQSFSAIDGHMLGWCNEDGHSLDLLPNVLATIVFQRVLLGNIYLTGWWDGKEDCLPINKELHDVLRSDRIPMIHFDTLMEYCNGT